METLRLIGTIAYFVVLAGLSCYGLHRYWIVYLYYRHRRKVPVAPGRFAVLPHVTVQLPLYNEMYVVERLVDAVVRLDYPRDKLEIQVLDDSTDETTEIVQRKVRELRQQGVDIQHVRRPNRTGFKAGALQHGLTLAKGELIAIFDADFVPGPELLQQTIHYFLDPSLGMLQARWGHLNERYSILTRVQSIILDGHFLIEQTARARSGRFFNFNGTAGLWRRTCIQDAGGWQADTLAEDLDLSYRAQLRGWQFLFLPEITVPAELPVEMNAFKTQQHRWAKGSVQTCKKILPQLWRSDVPLKIKIEGTVHLTSNFGYLLLLVMCLVLYAAASNSALQITGGVTWLKLLLVDLPLIFAGAISIVVFYLCAQRELNPRWWTRVAFIPVLIALGVGLSVNNARAVLEALFNHQSDFVRTPKYGASAPHGGRWRGAKYHAFRGLVPLFELAMGAYFSYIVFRMSEQGQWMSLPFLILMQAGFLYVGLMSLAPKSFTRLLKQADPTLSPAGA